MEAYGDDMMMSREDFAKKMQELSDMNDTEGAHCEMDDLLCDMLRELGYGEGVDIFEARDKWYA